MILGRKISVRFGGVGLLVFDLVRVDSHGCVVWFLGRLLLLCFLCRELSIFPCCFWLGRDLGLWVHCNRGTPGSDRCLLRLLLGLRG